MQQSPSVQMNTRIDSALKTAGDRVFARLGYTPSQAVRALWLYAVAHQDTPDEIRKVLDDDATRASDDEAARTRLAALTAGRSLCATLGPLPASIASSSYDDLRADAYAERYAQSL